VEVRTRTYPLVIPSPPSAVLNLTGAEFLASGLGAGYELANLICLRQSQDGTTLYFQDPPLFEQLM